MKKGQGDILHNHHFIKKKGHRRGVVNDVFILATDTCKQKGRQRYKGENAPLEIKEANMCKGNCDDYCRTIVFNAKVKYFLVLPYVGSFLPSEKFL